MEKRERKEPFAVNFFGSKSQPNVQRMSGAMVKVLKDPLL